MASRVRAGLPRTAGDQRQSLLNPGALCMCASLGVQGRVGLTLHLPTSAPGTTESRGPSRDLDF